MKQKQKQKRQKKLKNRKDYRQLRQNNYFISVLSVSESKIKLEKCACHIDMPIHAG